MWTRDEDEPAPASAKATAGKPDCAEATAGKPDFAEATAGKRAQPDERAWTLLAGCLGTALPGTADVLAREIARARSAGARPFEVVVGTPCARYGARITFETTADNRDGVAAALQSPSHPWGAPDWIGLRVSPAGAVSWKPYHRFDRATSEVVMPSGLPDALVPVMAAHHDGVEELYVRHRDACEWAPFVARVCAAVNIDSRPPTADPRLPTPECRPVPRAHDDSFGLSIKIDHGVVTALSLFADDRALPDDRGIPAEWTTAMDADDRAAYDAALAGVRALGPRPAHGWHAALAWTFDRRHGWSRAASLRLRAIG